MLIKRTNKKTTFENYLIDFLNSDFSVKYTSTCGKFLGYVPHSVLEGSVSQNFDLGPG